MKKQLRKFFALLAAGAVLTGSAAAYAAQLPSPTDLSLAPSSSGLQYGVNLNLNSYSLSPDHFTAEISASGWGSGVQFRIVDLNVTVERENGAGSNQFVKVSDAWAPYLVTVDNNLSPALQPGERMRLHVEAAGYAFVGYTPVSPAYASQDYYFTL